MRILVVSLDNVGDLVFASALFPPLRRRFPDSELAVWCKAYTAEIAALIPHVSAVFAADPFWDRSPGRSRGGMVAFWRSWRAVRRARFDLAIVTSFRWEVAAAVALARVPRRIGMQGRRNRPWLTTVLPPRDRSRPVLAEMARLLQPLDIEREGLVYRLETAALQEKQAALARELAGRRIVVLHPFASKRRRCVDFAVWSAVARELGGRGRTPLWFGTAPELEELRRTATADAGLYLDRCAAGGLGGGAAALASAELFIGHDSGPLHMAAALGVPCVGVFAPGEPKRTFPQGIAPFRLVARASPGDVTADAITAEVRTLLAEIEERREPRSKPAKPRAREG